MVSSRVCGNRFTRGRRVMGEGRRCGGGRGGGGGDINTQCRCREFREGKVCSLLLVAVLSIVTSRTVRFAVVRLLAFSRHLVPAREHPGAWVRGGGSPTVEKKMKESVSTLKSRTHHVGCIFRLACYIYRCYTSRLALLPAVFFVRDVCPHVLLWEARRAG